jgi:hypothetical protein
MIAENFAKLLKLSSPLGTQNWNAWSEKKKFLMNNIPLGVSK